MDNKYRKTKNGNSGVDGVDLQLDLIIVFLLNIARRNDNDAQISPENQDAETFDDIVCKFTDRSVLLQSKFKKTLEITEKQLFPGKGNDDDFCLAKYFFSYVKCKLKFKGITAIICTNAKVDPNCLKNVRVNNKTDTGNLLHLENDPCSFLTFKEELLPRLETSVNIYFDNHLQDKGMDRAVITAENIKEFLKNLQFFYNYPSGDNLHKKIDQLLHLLGDPWRITHRHDIYSKVKNWFMQPKGRSWNLYRIKAMLYEISSENYYETLKQKVSFGSKDLDITKWQRINFVPVTEGRLLQILKIGQALHSSENTTLFVNPKDDVEVQKETVKAFSLLSHKFLVLVWTAIVDETVKNEIISEIREMFLENTYKQVILVGGHKVELEQRFKPNNVYQIDSSITFQDFSTDSQEKLLKRNVLFQGDRVSLKELLHTQGGEDYKKFLNLVMLERLVKEKQVTVGIPPLDLDEGIAQYYVNRRFKRDIDGTQDIQNIVTEEKLYDAQEKMILISDSAGMGKSTFLAKLATTIKKTSFWILRINLNDYTRVLNHFVETNKHEITVAELLNSEESTKMANDFEKLVFSMRGKVVLMLDGVDEISPKFTHLVSSLLSRCQKTCNFAKIFVTTRSYVDLMLENVGMFKMLPFTKEEQIYFLTNYWLYNWQICHEEEEKCKQNATILIEKISSWAIFDIPLQLKMLGDIFREEAGWEYLQTENNDLLEKVNITKLCDKIIDKKKYAFVDKECPSRAVMATEALDKQFTSYLAYHRSLAVTSLLPEYQQLFKIKIPEDNIKEYLLKVGIVQNICEDVLFINKTFAEYFLARSILLELEIQNSDVNFLRLLMDVILRNHKFENVRTFLDNLLDTISVPNNIFQQYRSLKYEEINTNLIFQLAREGHVTILRLILETVHFKVIRGRSISVTDWRLRIPFRKRNALNDLGVLVHQAGVNIKNEDGETPVHYAVKGGHLQMVDFLFKQGADVNVRGGKSRTALHLATYRMNWNIIKCLVEHGADVDSRDSWGFTALHRIIIMGTLDIVGSLLNRTTVNDKDNEYIIAQLLTIYKENSNIVKYLVKHGTDVSITDHSGLTALHHVIVLVALDIVACLADTEDNEGLTAVYVADKLNKTDIIEFFLKYGSSVNAKHGENRCVQHLAAYWNHLKVVNSTS